MSNPVEELRPVAPSVVDRAATGSILPQSSTCSEIHRRPARFRVLDLAGESGRFVYGWIPDILRCGRETVDRIAEEESPR